MTFSKVLAISIAALAGTLTSCGPSNQPAASTAKVPTSAAYQTVIAAQQNDETRVAAEDARVTPTIPTKITSRETLMFCVPLQPAGGSGPGQPMAYLPEGSSVVYAPGTCDPQVGADGTILVRSGGSTMRVPPQYGVRAFTDDEIVWMPGLGHVNGVAAAMTGRFIATDATVEEDSLGEPLVLMHTTADGRYVLSALTRQISAPNGGLQLAIFLNGTPLRGRDGRVLAPRVQSEITDTLAVMGLGTSDAHNLAALVDSGMLR
jgi:hypothetical protein